MPGSRVTGRRGASPNDRLAVVPKGRLEKPIHPKQRSLRRLRRNSLPPGPFSLSGVPNGTKTLQFHMIDLDKPDYDHGGGNVAYTGHKTIPCGALNNYSPPSLRLASTTTASMSQRLGQVEH